MKQQPTHVYRYCMLMRTLDNEEDPAGVQKWGTLFTDCMGNLNFTDRVSGILHMRRPRFEFATEESPIIIGFVKVDEDLWVRQSWQMLSYEQVETKDV